MSPDDRLMLGLVAAELKELSNELAETCHNEWGHEPLSETRVPSELADRLVERLDYLSKKLEGMK